MYFVISPEPIIRNDFVEETEAFVHSVRGHVLIQRLVVPGHDNDDDNENTDAIGNDDENTDANGDGDEYMDVNDDDNEYMDVNDDGASKSI